jgi:hypothetical protein
MMLIGFALASLRAAGVNPLDQAFQHRCCGRNVITWRGRIPSD